MYRLLTICLLLTLFGCHPKPHASAPIKAELTSFRQYSAVVKDSFFIQTQLPSTYNDSTKKRYPVVVVLDGNFHFSMLAASVRQYEEGGLLPPVILIGIGYKSFKEMDSLRVRDYLYPAALPSDELKATGGGERFRQFITDELLPEIDSMYRTETANRTLAGHSFGGYFALYSLLKQASGKKPVFTNFVAASPSLWYHDFYLKQLPDALRKNTKQDSIRVFMSVGGLENPTWDIKPNRDLLAKLPQTGAVRVKGVLYNELGHMDTGQLSFLKGLQEFYR